MVDNRIGYKQLLIQPDHLRQHDRGPSIERGGRRPPASASAADSSTAATSVSTGYAGSSSQSASRRSPNVVARGAGSSRRHPTAAWPAAPASTPSASSRSSTSRAIGPTTDEIGGGERARRGRQVARLRHDAPRRLVAAHAAPVRRETDRSADVAAELEGGHAGRDGRRRATRRPAGGAGRVPRVVARPEDRVVGLPVARHGRGVGLAEDHRTRTAQPPHRLGVVIGHVVPGGQPARGPHSRRLIGVLDGHRHAVQRADVIAARERRVGGIGGNTRAVGVERDDGVQRAVERFDAGQVVLQQLAARQVATPDGLRQRMCGLQSDVRHAKRRGFGGDQPVCRSCASR